jgi:hypothetical protein
MPVGDIRALVTLLKTELDRPEVASDVRRAALTAAWLAVARTAFWRYGTHGGDAGSK